MYYSMGRRVCLRQGDLVFSSGGFLAILVLDLVVLMGGALTAGGASWGKHTCWCVLDVDDEDLALQPLPS